jgi:response regulator NasT
MSKTVTCFLGEELLGSLKKRLENHQVAGITASDSLGELYDDALRKHPGVAVIEYSVFERGFNQTIKNLWGIYGIPIIIIAESGDFDSILKGGESMIAAILAKPVRDEELIAAIVLSITRGKQLNLLRNEISNLKESIEARKIIEKAKGRLMERDFWPTESGADM